MKLREIIERAVHYQDARAAARAADIMRARGLDYFQSYILVQEVCPKVTPADWDGLLYEADEMHL